MQLLVFVQSVVERTGHAVAVGCARVVASVLADGTSPIALDRRALTVSRLRAPRLLPLVREVALRAVDALRVLKLLTVHCCPLLRRRAGRGRDVTYRARIAEGVIPGVADNLRPGPVWGGQTAAARNTRGVADGVLEVVLGTFAARVRLRHVVAVDDFEGRVA